MGFARRDTERPRSGLSGRRDAGVLLLFGPLLALAGCASVFELQSRYLYQPPEATTTAALPDEAERWTRSIEGGQVHAFYLPPRGTPDGPAPAVVFAHGSRERAEPWIERLEPYRRLGLAVLVPEYRGYGGAAGQPSEADIVGDFAHFVDRLEDRPDIDAQRVAFHGRALGGGVVGALSTRRRCRALVLESTFTNVPDLVSRWLAPIGSIRDRFDTRAALLASSTPTLVLHGVEDAEVPFGHARELHRIAWESTLVAFEAGHEVPREAAYWRHVRKLLEAADLIAEAGAEP